MTQHAIQRAEERYGLKFTKADMLAIVRMVNSGRTIFTKRKRDGAEVHTLAYAGKSVVALINRDRTCVVSFYPASEINSRGTKLNTGKKSHAPHLKHRNKPISRRVSNRRGVEE